MLTASFAFAVIASTVHASTSTGAARFAPTIITLVAAALVF
jgi:hypothetical protein